MRLLALLFFSTLALMTPAQAQVAPRRATPPAQAPAQAAAPTPAASELGNIRLTSVRLTEVARLLSQVGNANVVVTAKVAELEVSLYLHNASVEDMVRNTCRAAGVWYRLDPRSKTYVIMSAEEYQKDLAIVRDEKTRVFTLRHHNVVSTANAVKGLFGQRVLLSEPVEEALPSSLGSATRTRTAGNNNAPGGRAGTGSGTGSGSAGGASAGQGGAAGSSGGQAGNAASPTASGGRGTSAAGGAGSYDPGSDLKAMSQDRMAAQTQYDARGQAMLGVADIQAMAARQGPPILVTYNKLNNLLMVRTGDEQALTEIAHLVAEMDRPPKQVLLEMKILEVTLDDGFRSAFDIGQSSDNTSVGTSGWGRSNSTNVNNSSSLGSGRFAVDTASSLIWQVMSSNLSLRLQLLARENKLKELSAPMLVATNNQVARLFIGDERILTVGASSQSTTGTTGATNTTITVETERRDVGQTLAILPRINGDRSVTLTVDQDSSTVKVGDASIPLTVNANTLINFPVDTVNTANLQVTAHARDGMTVAIGGMIRETEVRNDEKVPVLGDIPGLGFFFKRDTRSKVRTQIVLLVTPRIIETAEEGAALAQGKADAVEADAARFPTSPIVPKPALAPLEPER
ncbi:MAG: type II secretion system protein GspD [Rhodoferax sp.]